MSKLHLVLHLSARKCHDILTLESGEFTHQVLQAPVHYMDSDYIKMLADTPELPSGRVDIIDTTSLPLMMGCAKMFNHKNSVLPDIKRSESQYVTNNKKRIFWKFIHWKQKALKNSEEKCLPFIVTLPFLKDYADLAKAVTNHCAQQFASF